MKKLITSTVLLISLISTAQNNWTVSNASPSSYGNAKLEDYLTDEDKFNGEKTYSTNTEVVSFWRTIKKGISRQYVSVTVKGSTLNYGCYGVYILFNNGQKIMRKNEKVETAYSDGFEYRAFFTPTDNEIKLLQNQEITDVKLYIYDATVDRGETIMNDAKIILKLPKTKKKK